MLQSRDPRTIRSGKTKSQVPLVALSCARLRRAARTSGARWMSGAAQSMNLCYHVSAAESGGRVMVRAKNMNYLEEVMR